MTISNTTRSIRASGDGFTTTFAFPFPVFNETNIKVYKIDTTTTPETANLQTLNVDYTVSLSSISEGGSVTFTTAPTTDEDAFIIRDITYTQGISFTVNEAFDEENLEDGFDKTTMLAIQLQDDSNKSIKVNDYYIGSADFTLPNPSASKVIGWDSTGLALANFSSTDLQQVIVTEFGEDLVTSADAQTARDFLQLGTSDDVEFNDITLNVITCNQITASTYVGIPKISGDVVQIVNETVTSVGTGNTIIPIDDTIPQKTEGNEYITKSITPTKATNKLKIEVDLGCLSPAGAVQVTAALFQDDNADALAVATQVIAGGSAGELSFLHYMTAGTTSPTTFKIRVGPSGATTVTFNGIAGSRLFGGKASSTLTITEIET